MAERKVNGLLECGASVKVIALSLTAELEQMGKVGKIRSLKRNFEPGDLRGAFMAIAATDDKGINQVIAREGAARGVLVNIVDDAGNSDFILPALLRRGNVTVAISTSGQSPALARKLRLELEKYFGNELDSLSELISEVRAELKKQGKQVSGDKWEKHLDLNGLRSRVKEGEFAEVKKELLSLLSTETIT